MSGQDVTFTPPIRPQRRSTIPRRVAIPIMATAALVFVHHASTYAQESIRVRQPPPRSRQEYVPGEIIVKFREGTPDHIVTSTLTRWRASRVARGRFAAFHRVRIAREAAVGDVAAQLAREPSVEYAEPNYIAHAFWKPNDKLYRYQWNLDNPQHGGGVQAEKAWDAGTGDRNVIVAVVDTGIAYENFTQGSSQYYQAPDLSQTCLTPGYDFVNADAHPNDDEGHGTHVAGTIAQSTNNAMGTAGLAFQSCVMPVKALDSSGSGTHADIADGIRFAADNGAKIVNLSLGGPNNSTTLRDAMAYAYNKGVTLVCAAGNDGSATTLSYPAAYDNYCIAVGATRYDETPAYYSNHGNSLDLVAPGGDINVDQNGDGYPDGILQQTFGASTNDWGYFFYQGTSMAAPHVSGVAALVIARGIATTPAAVRTVLQSTAKDLGAPGLDSAYGYGLVNAQAALAYGTPPEGSPCDLNKDGATNVTDVQGMVNQAVGVAACAADLNKDTLCNIIDVQRVVNAALGGTCVSP